MEEDRRESSSTFIFNSIFVAMGMLLLGVASWIAISVTDIPVMKNQLSNISLTISGYSQQQADLERRLRRLEEKE